MEARELMIGDFVYIPRLNKNIQVSSIDYDNRLRVGNANIPIGWEIRPIPLSEEILKNNGFTTSNEHWYYKRIRENGIFDVCVSLDYKEIEITKVCGAGTDAEEADYGSSIELGNDVPLVHKFQQVLRSTYNLTELADNFKI